MNSFAYLIQISNIFLNASIFRTNSNNLCVLTRSFERIVARKIKSIAKTFVFFKSINLIVSELSFVNNDIEEKFWCDLVIYFLQFNLHLNLKTDALFEVFYYSCRNKLIINTNKFTNNYNSVCGIFTKSTNSFTPTFQEFSNALTQNGYPEPSTVKYTNFISGLSTQGGITTKREAAMFLAQIIICYSQG